MYTVKYIDTQGKEQSFDFEQKKNAINAVDMWKRLKFVAWAVDENGKVIYK